jgi:hypothetical protein
MKSQKNNSIHVSSDKRIILSNDHDGTRVYKRIYSYKPTTNRDYWQRKLKHVHKRLTKKDISYLSSVRNEYFNNCSLQRIHEKALKNNLYIPCLTKLVGNCMFESLEHAGLCENHDEFRKAIAILFFTMGDCDIISTYTEPLKEVFTFFNDIEYVYCYKTEKLYKYSYYTMCSDMYKNCSWSRLPTELILTVIATLFKVRIHIYNDTGNVIKICDKNLISTIPLDDDNANIYLALIGENHYVPLTRIPDGTDINSLECPKYLDNSKLFHKWAKTKADIAGLYSDVFLTESDLSDNSDDSDEASE